MTISLFDIYRYKYKNKTEKNVVKQGDHTKQ